MVSLSLDLSGLVTGEQADPSDYTVPLGELKGYLEDALNGVQAFDGLLAGSGPLDASLIVQFDSVTQTFVIPSMTESQRDAISSPLERLLIYNNETKLLNFYNGSSWVELERVITEAGVRLITSVNLDVDTATPTNLSWDTESYDTDTMHDTVTNNSRITFNKAGVYCITAQAKTTATISNEILLEIVLNGTTTIAAQRVAAIASGTPYVNLPCTYKFEAGDYVTARVTHTSGVTRTIDKTVAFLSASLQLQ